jgi:hypothetical protein
MRTQARASLVGASVFAASSAPCTFDVNRSRTIVANDAPTVERSAVGQDDMLAYSCCAALD